MTTPTLDLPALKALAEQATPGEWIACQMSHFERGGDLTPDELGEYVANAVRKSQATSGSSRFLFVSVMKTDGPADVCHVGNGPTSPANAAFIAAANPTTVLALLAEVERLREERDTAQELTRMQLAAIMHAALANTPKAAADRIERDHPYWSVAYADVCRAVDREMRERERAEQAESALATVTAERDRLREAVDDYNAAADKFIAKCESGKAISRETYADLKACRALAEPRKGE